MKKIIIYLLIGFCVISCRNTTTNNEPHLTEKASNKFIGLWESVKRPIPYRSQLTIKADSTFQFEYGACESHGFSSGTWRLKDTTIILNSHDIDSCLQLSHFGVDCIKLPKDITEIVRETTISDCELDGSDDFVDFDNERFYLDFDTLRHIVEKPKLCPEIRNDFYRIEIHTTANSGE